MAEQVTKENFPGLAFMFRHYDTNGNGYISSSEYNAMWKSYGKDQDLVKREIEEVDADLDGKLNFSEFVHRMGRQMKQDMKDGRHGVFGFAFTEFDQDNSGCISFEELRVMMTIFGEKMTDDELKTMLNSADVEFGNGDGKVSKEEFMVMMQTKYIDGAK